MSDPLAEAKARALAVAAKLNSLPGIGGGSVLGKRFRDGEQTEKKIYVPLKDFPDINYRGILIGPKGKHQKDLEERTGASVLVRGRGTERPGDPPEDEEMHVVLRGSQQAVERATKEVEAILRHVERHVRWTDRARADRPHAGARHPRRHDHRQRRLPRPADLAGVRRPTDRAAGCGPVHAGLPDHRPHGPGGQH
eukprot:scaffold5143_cov231-Pinguiococcus_pyrenoidosus.AAC.2